MAQSSDTPLARRLSITELAKRWNVGTTRQRFVDLLVERVIYLAGSSPGICLWVFSYGGLVSLGDYFQHLDHYEMEGHDFYKWRRQRIAVDIMLGPADVLVMAVSLRVRLPFWFNDWARAGQPSQQPAQLLFWFNHWARAGQPSQQPEPNEPEPPEPNKPNPRRRSAGRPTRRDKIRDAFTNKLSKQQRALRGKRLYIAIREEIHPELGEQIKGGFEPTGLSSDAIDDALRDLAGPE